MYIECNYGSDELLILKRWKEKNDSIKDRIDPNDNVRIGWKECKGTNIVCTECKALLKYNL